MRRGMPEREAEAQILLQGSADPVLLGRAWSLGREGFASEARPYFERRRLGHTQPQAHLLIQKAATRSVGLHPLSIDDHLRNGLLANVAHHLFGCSRRKLNIDFGVVNAVLR